MTGIRAVAAATVLAGLALSPAARATLADVSADAGAAPSVSYSLEAAPAPLGGGVTFFPNSPLTVVPESTTVLAGGLAVGVLALGLSRGRRSPAIRIGA